MEMDDCDKKNLYEVTEREVQEMEFEDKGVVKTNHQVISKKGIGVAIFNALVRVVNIDNDCDSSSGNISYCTS